MIYNNSILLVDDDIDLANLFEITLQRYGYFVSSFTNPYLALNHFKSYHKSYSLIITDLKMPDLNGVQFAAKIREIDKQIKILIMTAYEIEDIINTQEYISANIKYIIQKPISNNELLEIIKWSNSC